ncbi:hypothetical protein GCM10007063_30020 [Lentibacillus kapialis]|uniref:DUF4129 domain-containing protein n=1 Tax=Lentibacillus kapialis TaxID=340214 RepID=A0A917Q1J1_9BACI|nr:hypothetical protein GCM10007063_30020 [Lentibacillus kapialis]
MYSESVLFLFLLIPIFAMTQYPIPFWSYLFITGLCILLCDTGLWIIQNYIVYIPAVMIMFYVMYDVFNYPNVIALLWIGFMTWRHVHFNRNGFSDNQVAVLMLTMLMLLIGVMFFNHSNLIWLAAFQMVMMLCAYWYRLVINGETNSMPVRTTMTFGAFVLLLLIGGGVIYGIYPFIINLTAAVFSGIGAFFEYTVFGMASIADKLGIDFRSLKDMVDGEAVKEAANKLGGSIDRPNGQKDTDNHNSGGMDLINGWTISLGLTAIMTFLGIYLSRIKFAADNQADQSKSGLEAVSITPIKSNPDRNRTFLNKQSITSPHEPVRKKVFKFEQLANTKGWGRQSSETIEEWLYRLKCSPSHLDIYQKVRYGEKNITEEEQHRINDLLENLIHRMKNER